MRAETRILSQAFKLETAASLLNRRIKTNHAEAIAIIKDLEQHDVLEKLIDLLPHLAPDVLHACSATPQFQDLLIQPTGSTGTPAIFTTSGEAFSTLAASVPTDKLRHLFLATSPERIAQVLSARCPDETQAFDLLLSLDLGVEVEDAVVQAYEPVSTTEPGAVDSPNAASGGAVTAGSTFSPNTALARPPSPPFISPRKSSKPALPHTSGVPTPAADGANVPTRILVAAPPTFTAGTAAGSPASPPPAPPPNPTTAPAVPPLRQDVIPRAAAPVPPTNMPTATALKARLLLGPAASRPTIKSDKTPRPGKGRSSHPQKEGSSSPSGSDKEMDEDSPDESGDEYRELKVLSGSDLPGDPDSADDSGSSSDDDNVPLTALKKGPKGRAGTVAAASRPAAALDPNFNEHALIYGSTQIPTPAAFQAKYQASINLDMWKTIRDFPVTYKNVDSDPGNWKKKQAKKGQADKKRADLPSVPRDTAIAARKKQWGEEYDSIVQHEKQQFFRLPPLLKELCGDNGNSTRHTGDIYVRRFWAPYLYVNSCIQDKQVIKAANTELVRYTELRFSHLAQPRDSTVSSSEYSRRMKSFFSTVKKRIVERINGGVREPKVNQGQLDRAISFMSGELRRAAAPSLWYKDVGAAEVKEQVERRLLEYATEKDLPLDDEDVRGQRLGFRSSEISRLFRALPLETQQKYRKLAEDPNMDSAAFADASAPVLRSFTDAITEETGAIALCAFAVNTSQGPTLVFSQHGTALQSRGWLQSQGTAFLQPFIQAASDIFSVELGNLPVITARPAAPAEKIDHPWTNRTSQSLTLPPFRFPIAQNLTYNRELLRSAILNAIRLYSGASPSMEAVVDDVQSWIIPGTLPKLSPLMLDPQSMPTAVVQAWADHWQQSLDENSTLAPEARLTFRGQTVHANPPPLPTADDAGTEAEPEAPKAKGKSKARTAVSAKASAAASAQGSAAAPARQPRRSGLDVVVEIVPPADFDRSAYQHSSKIGPPYGKKRQPGLSSTLAASSVPEAPPVLAAAAISTEPGSGPRSQSPTAMDIDEGLETRPRPEPVVQPSTTVASSVIPPPTLANPSGPGTTSNQAQAAAPSTPTPPRRVRSVPPVGRLGGYLVEYASDPESPLKAASQDINLRSLTGFVSPPGNVPQLPTPAVVVPGPDVSPHPTSSTINPSISGQSLPNAVPPVNAILPPSASKEPTAATATNTAATPSTHPGPTSGTTASSQNPSAPDVASDLPDKPPSYLRPRPKSSSAQKEGDALSVGRSTREASILLKEMVSYELSKGKEKKAIEERLTFWKTANPWTMDSFPNFMRTASAATPWAIKHSNPALGTLAPLLQGALVTAWYSVAESPEEGQTSKKNRFKLLLPWHNLAAGSPADFLFELLLDPTKPLPLLSSLTSVDGGWSLLDLGRFMEGLVFAVEVAFNNVAAAPIGLLVHSWVDAVPIARAIAFLRLTRSLHNVEGYSGPSLQDIDTVTDRVIIFVNAISMLRFITHRVLQTVPNACDDEAKKSLPVRKLWERYISALSTVTESVAAAAALGRTDFFSNVLPEILPQALVSVAQTAMRHPAWWYGFQNGKTFGPKPLTIQTRNNLLANGLGKWCAALTPQQWNALSGLDRTLLGILLSMATLQEVGPGGPKELTQVKDFTDDLTRIQALVHLSNSTLGGETGPLFARDPQAAAGSLEWDSKHQWASCRAAPARTFPELDTDDEELDTFSSGVDQEDIVRQAEAIAEGRPIHQTPKKGIFSSFKPSATIFGSSPLSSPGYGSITNSSPARATTSAAAANEAVGPSKLPALPQISESEDQLGPLPGSKEVATRKRKHVAAAKPKTSKRARAQASSDVETPPAQGSSTGRPVRSTRKKTPSVS